MNFNKQFIFKILFLMMFSLKLSFVVYQNISQLSSVEKISCLLEVDESEEEEKNGLADFEKIQIKIDSFFTFSFLKKQKHHYVILLKTRFYQKNTQSSLHD